MFGVVKQEEGGWGWGGWGVGGGGGGGKSPKAGHYIIYSIQNNLA